MTIQLRQLAKYVAAFLLLFIFMAAPVLAGVTEDELTPTQTQHCMETYNNKTFVKGSKKAKEFNGSSCNDKKYCTSKDAKQGDKSVIEISCSNSNPDQNSGVNTDSDRNKKEKGETSADPALACSRGDCDIIKNYVNPAITLMTILVGLAVVGGIIWGAIQVITSAGDPQKAASGKDHIRNAVIAVIAYVFLWAFLQWAIPGGFI